jgi:hypothetical protein
VLSISGAPLMPSDLFIGPFSPNEDQVCFKEIPFIYSSVKSDLEIFSVSLVWEL